MTKWLLLYYCNRKVKVSNQTKFIEIPTYNMKQYLIIIDCYTNLQRAIKTLCDLKLKCVFLYKYNVVIFCYYCLRLLTASKS